MKINGYEKFSMVDYGDNICCTVFTGGCNMRCPFCHNGLLVVGDYNDNNFDDGEVIEYLKKRKGLVDAVSVTGGEATLQEGLADFLKRVRDLGGYKIKLDTNGLRPDVLEDLLKENLVDYFAMDIKNCKEKYPLTTGLKKVDMDKIQHSIDIITSCGKDYEFRTTVIKEFHTLEDMRKIGEWLDGTKRYFMQKYKDSEGCISHGFHPIEKEEVEEYKKELLKHIEFVGLRGYSI